MKKRKTYLLREVMMIKLVVMQKKSDVEHTVQGEVKYDFKLQDVIDDNNDPASWPIRIADTLRVERVKLGPNKITILFPLNNKRRSFTEGYYYSCPQKWRKSRTKLTCLFKVN